MGEQGRAGWKLAAGDPWLGKKGLESGSPATRPELPLQGRPVAAPTGRASLSTSPIILYLCFTLLFFFPLLLYHSGGGKGYNIFIFIIPNLCEAFNKTLFPHSQGY